MKRSHCVLTVVQWPCSHNTASYRLYNTPSVDTHFGVCRCFSVL